MHGLSLGNKEKVEEFETEVSKLPFGYANFEGLLEKQMEMYEMQLNVCCGQRPNYSSLKCKWVVKSHRDSMQTNVFKEIWPKVARLSKLKGLFFFFGLVYNLNHLDLGKC